MVKVPTMALMALSILTPGTLAIKKLDWGACFGDTRVPFHTPEFLSFETDADVQCYAEAGTLTDIRGVTGITAFRSGNNAGYFDYEPGDGSMYRHNFNKWETKDQRYGTLANIVIR